MKTQSLGLLFIVLFYVQSIFANVEGNPSFANLHQDAMKITEEDLDASEKALIAKYTDAYIAHLKAVVLSDDSEKQKTEKISLAANMFGEFFIKITSPYDDISTQNARQFLNSHAMQAEEEQKQKDLYNRLRTTKTNLGFPANVANYIVHRVSYYFESVVHDTKSIPKVIPFVGVSTERSVAISAMAKKLKTSVVDSDKMPTKEACSAYCQAIQASMAAVAKSEPMKYGVMNDWTYKAYLGLAVYFFINPNELFFEPTTVGPMFYAIAQSSMFLLYARARKLNSGLGFYKMANSINDKANQIISTCQDAMLKK